MSWSVAMEPHPDALDVPWAVYSPRGQRCFSARDAGAAVQVAAAMTGIDALLERINNPHPKPAVQLDNPPERPGYGFYKVAGRG